MIKPELLAPAGNLKKLKYALTFGADAVYCGLPNFSLRYRINNFNYKDLAEGVEFAHKLRKKIYVTINIFPHKNHLNILGEHIEKLKPIKPDALIVSDPGILSYIKTEWPEAEIHLSTQANCTNWRSAKFWYDQGVTRVILAREATLEDIQEIHKKVPEVELETFVHGAMCMAYSGRCILSKWFTDRSANLGDCSQPCRWKYNLKSEISNQETVIGNKKQIVLEESQRKGNYFPIEEDENGTYIMNSKDLCLIKQLKELQEAGIVSFKIEGRAKSIYYLGNTLHAYREAIDNPKTNTDNLFDELNKAPNRGFTTGFIFGEETVEHRFESSQEPMTWEFCGEVIDYDSTDNAETKLLKLLVHNTIKVGDTIELVVPRQTNTSITIDKLYDHDMKEITDAHGGQDTIVFTPSDLILPEKTLLRRKIEK